MPSVRAATTARVGVSGEEAQAPSASTRATYATPEDQRRVRRPVHGRGVALCETALSRGLHPDQRRLRSVAPAQHSGSPMTPPDRPARELADRVAELERIVDALIAFVNSHGHMEHLRGGWLL